jgi:hypothetical protein
LPVRRFLMIPEERLQHCDMDSRVQMCKNNCEKRFTWN